MSLQADSIIIEAVSSDSALMAKIGSRVYDTTAAVPDEDVLNIPVPYVMVTYDGMVQDNATKDDYSYEADEDIETVSVELAAPTRETLADLAATVRTTVREYVSTADFEASGRLNGYSISAGAVNYDTSKPCFWQILTYQITTPNIQ